MDKLLYFYEQELGRLRRATRDFAEAHPDTAAALELGPDASTDPEVERLLQSVALLNAATQKLIEDGRSDFHKALLQTLQPHYLRPIPACGIAQVDTSAAGYNGISTVTRLPRGTIMSSGSCKFTTAYEVCIAPVAISQVKFHSTIDAPVTLRLPSESTSALSVTIEATSDGASLDGALLAKLRVCITGDPDQRACLVDALLLHGLCTCLEVDGSWKVLPRNPFAKVGFEQAESLLPATIGEQAPRILSEYSQLPQKFDFVDIELLSAPPQCRRITLHVVLPSLPHSATSLRQASAENFQLSCTPLINLFRGPALQVRLDGRTRSYPLTLSSPGCEIYSVDSVALMHRTGAKIFLPFHGACHDTDGVFWKVEEEEGAAISFIDKRQHQGKLDNGTALVEITCTNSETSKVARALKTEVGTGGFPIHFLVPPTPHTKASQPRALLEAIQSNDISLESIRTVLLVHQLTASDAFKDFSDKAASAWMDFPIGRVHMLGTEFSLTIDEEMLHGRSLSVMAGILEHVIAAKTRRNRFIQLSLIAGDGRRLYHGNAQIGCRGIV
ncbi:type VI secretion system baseplate subunit TssF [Pseudoduganella sp. HUAS MS19]